MHSLSKRVQQDTLTLGKNHTAKRSLPGPKKKNVLHMKKLLKHDMARYVFARNTLPI
jgi:hypothetical protein